MSRNDWECLGVTGSDLEWLKVTGNDWKWLWGIGIFKKLYICLIRLMNIYFDIYFIFQHKTGFEPDYCRVFENKRTRPVVINRNENQPVRLASPSINVLDYSNRRGLQRSNGKIVQPSFLLILSISLLYRWSFLKILLYWKQNPLFLHLCAKVYYCIVTWIKFCFTSFIATILPKSFDKSSILVNLSRTPTSMFNKSIWSALK